MHDSSNKTLFSDYSTSVFYMGFTVDDFTIVVISEPGCRL